MFDVGEVAVYPGHGVGKIESIEEKEFSGTKQSFYIIRILDTDMTIMIPIDGAKNAGLRCVISSCDVTKVYEILKDKNIAYDNSPWNRRYKEYMERIKSGSIFEVATVLKELYNLRHWKELSFGEKKMFEMFDRAERQDKTSERLSVESASKSKRAMRYVRALANRT